MKRVSFSETIFLFFLALIVFGPKKLPEIARQIGKVLNEFRRASNEFKSQIEQEIAHLEVEKHRQTVLQSTPPEGTTSRTMTAGSELGPSTEPPATLAASSEAPQPSAAAPLATEAVTSTGARSTAVSETSASESQQESHA